MFCKWCGNTIKTTDKKCSSCGRETPPLSECGGFYDLKRPWEAETPAAVPLSMGGDPGAQQEIHRLREENKTIRQEANQRQKTMTIICGALAGAFLIVLILWIVALCGDEPAAPAVLPGGNAQATTPAETQESTVPGGSSEPSIPAETTGSTEPLEEPTESRVASVTLLKDKEIRVGGCDDFENTKLLDGNGVTVTLYWAKAAEESNEQGKGEPETDRLTETLQGGDQEAVPTALDRENADKLTLTATWHEKLEAAISLSCDSTAMTGFEKADISYLWQWAEIPAPTAEGETEPAVTWNIIETDAGELTKANLGENIKQLQLRCTVTLTNEAGETLTVELDGFLVDNGESISFREPNQTTTENN